MVGQQEDNVRLDMILSSLPNQTNHLQASLANENTITIPFKGTTYSSTSVCMNTLNIVNKERNIPKTLQTLHKQAKIWPNIVANIFHGPLVFFNNGNFPNCEQI